MVAKVAKKPVKKAAPKKAPAKRTTSKKNTFAVTFTTPEAMSETAALKLLQARVGDYVWGVGQKIVIKRLPR